MTGVDFTAAPATVPANVYALCKPRVAMYQHYGGGNPDEGWSRLMFEQFSIPVKTLMDAEIKKGDLNASYDVIILPADSANAMTGEPAGAGAAGGGGRGGRGGAAGAARVATRVAADDRAGRRPSTAAPLAPTASRCCRPSCKRAARS